MQKYPASVDRWKACERRDRELRANFGGEVRSRGVDRQCEELSDMRLSCFEGLTVMPEESPVGASAANAVIERGVWEIEVLHRIVGVINRELMKLERIRSMFFNC